MEPASDGRDQQVVEATTRWWKRPADGEGDHQVMEATTRRWKRPPGDGCDGSVRWTALISIWWIPIEVDRMGTVSYTTRALTKWNYHLQTHLQIVMKYWSSTCRCFTEKSTLNFLLYVNHYLSRLFILIQFCKWFWTWFMVSFQNACIVLENVSSNDASPNWHHFSVYHSYLYILELIMS